MLLICWTLSGSTAAGSCAVEGQRCRTAFFPITKDEQKVHESRYKQVVSKFACKTVCVC